MIFRNNIKEYRPGKTPDNAGGYAENLVFVKDIKCKISYIDDVEILNQYGTHNETMISLISMSPLNLDHYYVINDKKFNIRKSINKNRLNYYILGEIV